MRRTLEPLTNAADLQGPPVYSNGLCVNSVVPEARDLAVIVQRAFLSLPVTLLVVVEPDRASSPGLSLIALQGMLN
jgi:hypothetical protein